MDATRGEKVMPDLEESQRKKPHVGKKVVDDEEERICRPFTGSAIHHHCTVHRWGGARGSS
jgi:hypothetical protein